LGVSKPKGTKRDSQDRKEKVKHLLAVAVK